MNECVTRTAEQVQADGVSFFLFLAGIAIVIVAFGVAAYFVNKR